MRPCVHDTIQRHGRSAKPPGMESASPARPGRGDYPYELTDRTERLDRADRLRLPYHLLFRGDDGELVIRTLEDRSRWSDGADADPPSSGTDRCQVHTSSSGSPAAGRSATTGFPQRNLHGPDRVNGRQVLHGDVIRAPDLARLPRSVRGLGTKLKQPRLRQRSPADPGRAAGSGRALRAPPEARQWNRRLQQRDRRTPESPWRGVKTQIQACSPASRSTTCHRTANGRNLPAGGRRSVTNVTCQGRGSPPQE